MVHLNYLSLFFLSCLISCKEPFKRTSIGQNVSGPSDVIFHKGSYVVLNTNGSYRYQTGSLLVISPEGDKLSAIETPRLGKSLYQTQDYIIATFEPQEVGSKDGSLEVYQMNQNTLSKTKTYALPQCSPLDAILSQEQLVVSCIGGKILSGSLTESQMTMIRNYHPKGLYSFKALYVDESKHLLFGFVSNLNEASLKDKVETSSPESLGAPDSLIDSDVKKELLKKKGTPYRYFVIDMTKDLVLKTWSEHSSDLEKELKWLSFTLPDDSPLGVNQRHYRTNFWHSVKDPSLPDVFYLSHRGSRKDAQHKSNILKMTIQSDFSLTAERVFSSKKRDYEYFTNFEMLPNGKGFLVNTFHDLLNFTKSQNYEIYFEDKEPLSSQNLDHSYYHVALDQTSGDRFMVISWFDNSLRLFEAKSGQTIQEIKRIL